jgi:DNA repair exonuclease SbcCD ATPase subunit
MTETHWDPGNLLQITEPERESEIQCVGRNKYDSRCRWTKSGDEAAAIRSMVRRLAVHPPAKATQQDLESLARLCLCESYHSHQWPQVTRRWKSVVATAVKHHDKKSSTALASSIEDKCQLLVLLFERRKCLEILGVQVDDPDLVVKLTAYVSNTARERRENEAKVEQLQSDLATAHACVEKWLRELEEAHKGAELRELALTKEHRAELDQVGKTATTEINRLTMTATAQIARLGEQFHMYTVKLLGEAEDNWKCRVAREVEEKAALSRLLEEEKIRIKDMEEAMEGLEHQISETKTRRDDQLEQEKDKTRRLEEANHDLEARLSSANAEAERLLNEAKAKTAQLLETQEKSKRQLSEAEAKIAKSAAEANKADRDNERLIQEKAEILEQLPGLKSDLATCRAAIRHVKDHHRNIERELLQSHTETQTLRSTNSQLTTERAALRAQLTVLESALSKTLRHRLRAWIRKVSPLHPPRPPAAARRSSPFTKPHPLS